MSWGYFKVSKRYGYRLYFFKESLVHGRFARQYHMNLVIGLTGVGEWIVWRVRLTVGVEKGKGYTEKVGESKRGGEGE